VPRAAGCRHPRGPPGLACGSDPDRPDGDGEPPLLTCGSLGSVDVAEALIEGHAAVDVRDRDGNTALHRAVAHGHDGLVRWLLAHGAEADARNRSGATPLMAARTADAVEMLCAHGASVHAATADGTAALLTAAGAGRTTVVRALLARGADPHAANRLGETALHHAALVPDMEGGTACLEALLDAQADVNEETNEGMTPLMVAARCAHVPSVILLLGRGARVDAATRSTSRSATGSNPVSVRSSRPVPT
jgi:ankyrin repeat protein